MSERKVLNKYYPPDFDPSKIPRMKLSRNRQYTVRLMAPFNMRCVTCGEYIYKGKKFNARKEDVENQDYLGIRIYRFYIKCTRCLQEISFKTDPKNTDYEIEAGATRNFMALKLAEEQAKREEDELKEEEANNPMKLLENRTEQSRNEIELLESLEELKDLNRRQATVDYDTMLKNYAGESAEDRRKREEREDEEFIKSIKFSNASTSQSQKRVVEEIIEEVEDVTKYVKKIKTENGDDDQSNMISHASNNSASKSTASNVKPDTKQYKNNSTWNMSVGMLSRKSDRAGLVKVKSKTNEPKGGIIHVTKPSTVVSLASDSNSTVVSSSKNIASSSACSITSSNNVASSACLVTSSNNAASSTCPVTSSNSVASSACLVSSSNNVASSPCSVTSSNNVASSGLSLLAGYSDSGSDNDSD